MEEEYKNNIERTDLNKVTYKIAAVVVTYNRLELLKECIEAIRNQTRKLDEIIVVNNSSTDGTLEWLNEQKGLTVITQENSGGAGGFHTGIKTAYEKGYDWIWCMDDDVLPEKSAQQNLIDFLIDKPYRIAAIASRRLNCNSNSVLSGEVLSTDFSKIRHDFRYKLLNSEVQGQSEVINIFAATFEGMMINSKAIKEIGFPNKNFFIWHDDLEYSIKLNRYGKIFLVPASVFIKKKMESNEIINAHGEILKYLYAIRNLSFIEFHCLTDQKLNPVIRVLSLTTYFSRYLRLVLFRSSNLSFKIKYSIRGVAQIYLGYKGKLGLINE